jgi:hypothetical protein
MNALDWVTKILVIVGAINWALASFDWNLVEMILGTGTAADVVYWLVGLSGIWELVGLFRSK